MGNAMVEDWAIFLKHLDKKLPSVIKKVKPHSNCRYLTLLYKETKKQPPKRVDQANVATKPVKVSTTKFSFVMLCCTRKNESDKQKRLAYE